MAEVKMRSRTRGTAIRRPRSAPGPLALPVMLVGTFLTIADGGIVNVILPSLQHDLGAGERAVLWTVTAFILAFGVSLVPAGRLGDRYGRRRILSAGLVLFALGSAAAAAAGSAGLLIAARTVQGIAAGLINPQASGLIQQMFTGERRARAMGALGSTIAISTGFGPLVGALVLAVAPDGGGWRWAFCLEGLLAVLLLGAARWQLSGERGRGGRVNGVDGLGAALAGGVVLCAMLPLASPGVGRWWAWAAGALALVVALVCWERRYLGTGRQAIFDPALVRSPGMVTGCLIAMAFLAGVTGLPYLVSMYSQRGLGLGPVPTALLLVPNALASAVGAAIGGRLVTRTGRRVVAAGLLFALTAVVIALLAHLPRAAGTAGTAGAATAGAAEGAPGGPAAVEGAVDGVVEGAALALSDPATWALLGVFALFGLGTGMSITPNQTMSYRSVPTALAGSAAGLLQTAQRFGSAVGAAAAGAALAAGIDRPDGTWPDAFRAGLWTVAASVALALLLALVDLTVFGRPSGAAGGRTGTSAAAGTPAGAGAPAGAAVPAAAGPRADAEVARRSAGPRGDPVPPEPDRSSALS